jgi:putative acetyltransferase
MAVQRPVPACGAGTASAVSSFALRELVPADYDRVLALWTVTEGMGLNESDTREGIAAFLARNAGLSRVAEDSVTGEVLGALLCGHDGRRGYLHHLAVARIQRRRGIGRALVGACLEGLRAQGIPKCNLFLYANNEAGRSFWEHAGWQARVDLVMMQVSLSPA